MMKFELNGQWYETDEETLRVLREIIPSAKTTGDPSALQAMIFLGEATRRIVKCDPPQQIDAVMKAIERYNTRYDNAAFRCAQHAIETYYTRHTAHNDPQARANALINLLIDSAEEMCGVESRKGSFTRFVDTCPSDALRASMRFISAFA